MKSIFYSIFGAAIGDLYGSYWEGKRFKPSTLESSLDFQEYRKITDDTKMTCAIASALLMNDSNGSKDGDLQDFAITEMRRIGRKYKGGYGRGFGAWLYSDKPLPYGSWGNGACMRVSPAGISANSLEDALDNAEKVTEVTHNHILAISYAKIVAGLVYLSKAENVTKSDLLDWLKKASEKFGVSCYEQVIKMDLESLHENYFFDVSSQGTAPQAIYCFLSSNSFEDCLARSIYIGGDSDTVAAIACSMAAPFYGDSEVCPFLDELCYYIPEELEKIFENFSNRFCKASQ